EGVEACGSLGGSPLERAEVVDVEVAASLTGKQKRRAVAGHDPDERIESASLQWHGSRARLRLRDLQLAARERAANEGDTLLAVDVAFLKGGPLRRPQPSRRCKQRHRPLPRADRPSHS